MFVTSDCQESNFITGCEGESSQIGSLLNFPPGTTFEWVIPNCGINLNGTISDLTIQNPIWIYPTNVSSGQTLIYKCIIHMPQLVGTIDLVYCEEIFLCGSCTSQIANPSTTSRSRMNNLDKNQVYEDVRIQIFPNPSDGELHLEISNADFKIGTFIEIKDMNGKTVLFIPIINEKTGIVMDVSELASGIYNLVIPLKNLETKRIRIVKN